MLTVLYIFLFLKSTGIEMKFKNQSYPILIAPTHIPELNAVEVTADGIIFGASVTLTTLEHVLKDATHSMPGK